MLRNRINQNAECKTPTRLPFPKRTLLIVRMDQHEAQIINWMIQTTESDTKNMSQPQLSNISPTTLEVPTKLVFKLQVSTRNYALVL